MPSKFNVAYRMFGGSCGRIRNLLRKAGLRPTFQRIALGRLLFAEGDRHVTAEQLHNRATESNVRLSVATIYNTLHKFTQTGLLREIAVGGAKTYFDTNVADHHHFLIEGAGTLVDIPAGDLRIGPMPLPPEGYEIVRVDVLVRLKPTNI
jgi:Fur family transcriptional regulator, iron response regulator